MAFDAAAVSAVTQGLPGQTEVGLLGSSQDEYSSYGYHVMFCIDQMCRHDFEYPEEWGAVAAPHHAVSVHMQWQHAEEQHLPMHSAHCTARASASKVGMACRVRWPAGCCVATFLAHCLMGRAVDVHGHVENLVACTPINCLVQSGGGGGGLITPITLGF